MNHNKKNAKINNGGKSGKHSRSESSNLFARILHNGIVKKTFRVKTLPNVVHATECDHSTPRTRDTDALFRVVHT